MNKDMVTAGADIKDNNFNLIRIYLSLSVLFFHVHELSQKAALGFLNRIFNGGRAVDAFFIISGYLIIKSYQRSSSTKEYFIKRIKRIYPAYLTIILLCALSGFLVSSYTIADYFGSAGLYKYILANLVFLNFIHPTLPGVFENNFFHVVNGSLWSLKVEVGFYILLPLIVYLRSKIKFPILYGLLFLLSAGYFFTMMHLYHTTRQDIFLFFSRQIPGELFFFIIGATVAEIDGRLEFRKWIKRLGIPAVIALFLPLGIVGGAIAQALAIFFFAFTVPPLHYPFKREDLSYGIYIYHFPVIQVLIHYGWFNWSPFLGLAASLLITIILAALSWIFIEKPFILKKVQLKVNAIGELRYK
jgi:peptidoglycan/LPS O-acetylase OafA/YrhL